MTKILNKVFKDMHQDKSKFVGSIISSTLNVISCNNKEYDTGEVHEFSSYITEQMMNMGLQLKNDSKKNCRYSPELV